MHKPTAQSLRPSGPTIWPEWAVPVLVDGRYRGRIVARTIAPQPLYDVKFDRGGLELLVHPQRLRVISEAGAA